MSLSYLNDKQLCSEETLIQDNFVSLNYRNLTTPATEMYCNANKIQMELLETQSKEYLKHKECPITTLHHLQFTVPNFHIVYHGTESTSNLEPKIWTMVPLEMKVVCSLKVFINTMKKIHKMSFYLRCKHYSSNFTEEARIVLVVPFCSEFLRLFFVETDNFLLLHCMI